MVAELISSPCCVVLVVEYTTGIIDDDDVRALEVDAKRAKQRTVLLS